MLEFLSKWARFALLLRLGERNGFGWSYKEIKTTLERSQRVQDMMRWGLGTEKRQAMHENAGRSSANEFLKK